MTEKQFIEKFTKKEIIIAIFEIYSYRWESIAQSICSNLYQNRIDMLIKKLDKNLKESENIIKKDFQKWLENQIEHDRLSKEINTIMDAYNTITERKRWVDESN